MFGRMITGYSIGRLHAPFVCATVFIIEAAAFASLALIQCNTHWAPIMVIGFAHGAEVDCFACHSTARYFGMKSYRVVFGLLSVMAAIGNGFGPLFSGLCVG